MFQLLLIALKGLQSLQVQNSTNTICGSTIQLVRCYAITVTGAEPSFPS